VTKIFNSTKSAKLLHITTLSDLFNTVAMRNSLIKNHNSQTLSCTLRQ